MDMNKEDLLKILAEDDLGIFDAKPKNSINSNTDSKLVDSFEEIINFYEANHRLPEKSKDPFERRLSISLDSILKDPKKREALNNCDKYKWFTEIKEESLDATFLNDQIQIFDEDDLDIFNLKHVPHKTLVMPDYVAKRKACKDFDKYRNLFIDCHRELKAGLRTLEKFSSEQSGIKAECFYVLRGVLLYVVEIGQKEKSNSKINARLKCIFENGTESDMLLRSLATELYKHNGRRVSSRLDLKKTFNNDIEKTTGYIYVLKSLSTDHRIKSYRHLHKIGFTNNPVDSRINYADKDPTFLSSKVSLIASYKCFNLKPNALENLVHTFLSKARLDIEILDDNNLIYRPKEWFSVPFEIIDQTINLILNEQITHYQYDHINEVIIFRK